MPWSFHPSVLPTNREVFISFGHNPRGEGRLHSFHPSVWAKPKGERTADFLHLSVCGQNRGVVSVVTPIFLMFSLMFSDFVCVAF